MVISLHQFHTSPFCERECFDEFVTVVIATGRPNGVLSELVLSGAEEAEGLLWVWTGVAGNTLS